MENGLTGVFPAGLGPQGRFFLSQVDGSCSLTAESTALTVSSTFCAHGRDLRMFSLKGQYLNDHQLQGSEGSPENVLLQNIIKIEWKGGQGFHRLRGNSEISTLGKTSLIQRIIHTKWVANQEIIFLNHFCHLARSENTVVKV